MATPTGRHEATMVTGRRAKVVRPLSRWHAQRQGHGLGKAARMARAATRCSEGGHLLGQSGPRGSLCFQH